MRETLKVVIINFKTKQLRIRRGIYVKKDEEETYLKVFQDSVEPIPIPNQEVLRGPTNGGFMNQKKYVLLGTNDDLNYFFLTIRPKEIDEKIKKLDILPEDRKKWYLDRGKKIAERFSVMPNWQKALMLGGPVLTGLLIFAGLLLFILKGIPELSSAAVDVASACKCIISYAINNTTAV